MLRRVSESSVHEAGVRCQRSVLLRDRGAVRLLPDRDARARHQVGRRSAVHPAQRAQLNPLTLPPPTTTTTYIDLLRE